MLSYKRNSLGQNTCCIDILSFNFLQVVRHYHGHLSAIYSLDLHPTIDVLLTCGRDATARVIKFGRLFILVKKYKWYLHLHFRAWLKGIADIV